MKVVRHKIILFGRLNNMNDSNIEKPDNQIENADVYASDGTPSANISERDGTNNKKLKIMAFIVLGVLIMLVGLGIAAGRYGDNKQKQKEEEAEKLAQDQKKMAEGSSLNIAKDQETIAANTFQDMPAPADATDPLATDMTANAAAQPTVQQEPIVHQTPIQPNYNTYQEPDPNKYQQEQPYTPAVTPSAPIPQVSTLAEDNNDVLVDIYGTAKVSETNNEAKESGIANQFKSSTLYAGKTQRRGDTTMLLAKGTTLPCVLKTRIDSTYKGFTTCQIAKDIYSANGKVLLVERGSTVFGEQNTDIKQGQARVAVLWSRIETPKGVSVDIDSPATGQLGEMGIDAKVKTHFWKRFGGAIMLSLVQDVTANASTQLAKDGQQQQTTTQNTQNASNEMASKALENTINIPPTATVNHGKLIQILVVRDVDFGGIYAVRKR